MRMGTFNLCGVVDVARSAHRGGPYVNMAAEESGKAAPFPLLFPN